MNWQNMGAQNAPKSKSMHQMFADLLFTQDWLDCRKPQPMLWSANVGLTYKCWICFIPYFPLNLSIGQVFRLEWTVLPWSISVLNAHGTRPLFTLSEGKCPLYKSGNKPNQLSALLSKKHNVSKEVWCRTTDNSGPPGQTGNTKHTTKSTVNSNLRNTISWRCSLIKFPGGGS